MAANKKPLQKSQELARKGLKDSAVPSAEPSKIDLMKAGFAVAQYVKDSENAAAGSEESTRLVVTPRRR